MELIKLSVEDRERVRILFKDVFTKEPWNDDWSNDEQLNKYIMDLIGNKNSLTLGMIENNDLIAISMGHVVHWYSETEYYINELCVKTERQGCGIGKDFIVKIEKYLAENDINAIFLLTNRDTPAYSFYKNNGFTEEKNTVAFTKWF